MEGQKRIVKATPSDPYVSDARVILPAMKSTVARWISWIPSATSSAQGTSVFQSASPCGSNQASASQMAAKAPSAVMLTSSPARPRSARAFPATAITRANAATAASNASAAGSGRPTRPTRPSHARLWTARIARATAIAAHTGAKTAKSATDHRVPAESFADSHTDASSVDPSPSASPACFGALRSSVVA